MKYETTNADALAEQYEGDDLLFMPGYDAAIVGVVERCGQAPFIIYDVDLVIDINMEQGMTFDEAVEYFDFNQAGAWVGDSGPGFLHRPK